MTLECLGEIRMSDYGYTTLSLDPEVARQFRAYRDEREAQTTEALADLLDKVAAESRQNDTRTSE